MSVFTANSTNNSAAVVLGPTNCTLTAERWTALNGNALAVCCVILVTQTFNLFMFNLWRNKEPFVLLHVFLAANSLLRGFVGLFLVITRILPWNDTVSVLFVKLTTVFTAVFNAQSSVILLFISIDRWLSVEFPIQYRDKISKKPIFQSLPIIVAVTLLLEVPGWLVFWKFLRASCVRPPWVEADTHVWNLTVASLLILLLLLFQLRILVIAATIRIKILRSRRQVRGQPRSRHAVGVVRIVWSTLRPSMIVVLVSAVSSIGSSGWVNFEPLIKDPVVLIAVYRLVTVQHMFSPLVYVLFFPQYQAILVRLFTRFSFNITAFWNGTKACFSSTSK